MLRYWWCGLLCAAAVAAGVAVRAQEGPRFRVDPFWPQPLPDGWVNATLGHPCVDRHDHVVVVDRQNITPREALSARPTPPMMMFDREGRLLRSWGETETVPRGIHGCAFDTADNLWVVGNNDGIAQKYTHEGRLLLQVGTRGVVDTHDGTAVRAADNTINRPPLNAGRDRFFFPAAVAIDPQTDDVYIADGYGNKRVVVLDRYGTFLRQWGHQASAAETQEGAGGAFTYALHCIAISRAGLVYVCDREGLRIQVFEKNGRFVRNIWVRTGRESLPDPEGTVWGMAFSPDPEQRYLYVLDGRHEQVHVLDHESGRRLSSFGRPGHQAGAFNTGHGLAADSRGNLYVAESGDGRRVQRFVVDAP